MDLRRIVFLAQIHKTYLRKSKFVFRLRRATKNVSRQVKMCVWPAGNINKDLDRIIALRRATKNVRDTKI